MLRELIEKETAVVKEAVHAVREWIHPTKVMKKHDFDRPLDDLGQTIDDLERKVSPSAAEPKPPAK